ncbi:hypothetical protein D3C80_1869200 [compost metagenome]
MAVSNWASLSGSRSRVANSINGSTARKRLRSNSVNGVSRIRETPAIIRLRWRIKISVMSRMRLGSIKS